MFKVNSLSTESSWTQWLVVVMVVVMVVVIFICYCSGYGFGCGVGCGCNYGCGWFRSFYFFAVSKNFFLWSIKV